MSFTAQFTSMSDKTNLLQAFKGKSVEDLPTPAFVVDQDRFKTNSDKMLHNAEKLKADFRAHVKTHKTTEGTRLQLGTGATCTKKVVVSTLMEAWNLVPLVEEGKIDDMLFSLPVVRSKLGELYELSKKVPKLRLMLDGVEQVDELIQYNKANGIEYKWSLFIKINMGTNRAGLVNDTEDLGKTLTKLTNGDDDVASHTEIYGFYCHAGHSYASDSETKAKLFLLQEIIHANKAAEKARELDPTLTNLQISVGATPTAHASEMLSKDELKQELGGELAGNLELHAGNYPFCDLQQVATGCVSHEDVACKVMAEVVSTYKSRGTKPPGEQLINAGVIAMAREFGPLPGHGRVISPKGYENWIIGRLSQEHGILVPLDEKETTEFIPIGTKVGVYPQHSCITAASYPWYYVTSGDIVVDIWVPWRGW